MILAVRSEAVPGQYLSSWRGACSLTQPHIQLPVSRLAGWTQTHGIPQQQYNLCSHFVCAEHNVLPAKQPQQHVAKTQALCRSGHALHGELLPHLDVSLSALTSAPQTQSVKPTGQPHSQLSNST